MLTIALTKGRILTETLPLFKAADISPIDDIKTSRKLIFETNKEDVRFIILRGVDVPTYVRFGAADIGVSGKDMLMEEGTENLYEPLDLKIAKCKLMTAGQKGKVLPEGRIRVATKFVNVARSWYSKQGRQVDLIKLYGAMELAPNLDLADEIVDIVDTGNTLRANGLEAREEIADISTRLVVNKIAMKIKHRQITSLINKISQAVENTNFIHEA